VKTATKRTNQTADLDPSSVFEPKIFAECEASIARLTTAAAGLTAAIDAAKVDADELLLAKGPAAVRDHDERLEELRGQRRRHELALGRLRTRLAELQAEQRQADVQRIVRDGMRAAADAIRATSEYEVAARRIVELIMVELPALKAQIVAAQDAARAAGVAIPAALALPCHVLSVPDRFEERVVEEQVAEGVRGASVTLGSEHVVRGHRRDQEPSHTAPKNVRKTVRVCVERGHVAPDLCTADVVLPSAHDAQRPLIDRRGRPRMW